MNTKALKLFEKENQMEAITHTLRDGTEIKRERERASESFANSN